MANEDREDAGPPAEGSRPVLARRGVAWGDRSVVQRASGAFRPAAWFGMGIVVASLALLGFTACSSLDRVVLAPPDIEGASFVGNTACADCHTNYTRIFAASPHGRFHRPDAAGAASTGCESCHGPGSRHVATGDRRFIVNPREDPSSCLRCHVETDAELHLPYRHPVIEGRVRCVDCHDPHGLDILKPAAGLAMARLNETCGQCHREQHRPFVFEHEAMREGCVACHAPHGSVNPKLLVQRDANLCLKCHAQIQTTSGRIVIGKMDHTIALRQGTCFSAGCHTAVHGSNVQPKLRY